MFCRFLLFLLFPRLLLGTWTITTTGQNRGNDHRQHDKE